MVDTFQIDGARTILIPVLSLAFIAWVLASRRAERQSSANTTPSDGGHGSTDSHQEPAGPKKEPAHDESRGSGDHAHKKGGGLLILSRDLLVLVCVIAFGWWIFAKVGMVNTSAPHTSGITSHISSIPSGPTAPAPGEVISEQYEHSFTALPSGSRWEDAKTIPSKWGYGTVICSPTIDPTCEKAETEDRPVDYAMQCQRFDDRWIDWTPPDCRHSQALRTRSLSDSPLNLRWRYKPR